MPIRAILPTVLLTLAAPIAGAGISHATSDSARHGGGQLATFDELAEGDDLLGYAEQGISVSVDATAFQWGAPGMGGSNIYYADTGTLSRVAISLESGDAFSNIEMQIASGWNIGTPGAEYLWVQVFDEKELLLELDVDLISGGMLSLAGDQSFNTILIGAYATAEIRDEHDPLARNAIALDNIRVNATAGVPAPSTLALGAFGLAACSRRRR